MTSSEVKGKKVPLHALRIEDYAIIGDCETAALVSREGSIDWLCWPNFASPACFAALLGTAENGYWRIRPVDKIERIERRYVPGSMVLETNFYTKKGHVCVTDFMPPRGEHSDIIRRVSGINGKVKMRMELVLRFDYGLTVPWVTMHPQGLHAVAGPNSVTLRSHCVHGRPAELHGEGFSTVSGFTLDAGHEMCFTLTYTSSVAPVPPELDIDDEHATTLKYWQDWSARMRYNGPHYALVKRSLLTLECLTYRPTGGIVAAPTMGLPEQIGGERNWDYRYCWLRDTAFTLIVLIHAGYTEEAERWRAWLLRAVAGEPDQVQSVYGIGGERMLREWDVEWLRGYEDSKPVRSGNAASTQFQLDMYGEIVVALTEMPNAAEDVRVPSTALEAHLVDHVCKVWDQPDDGIWETRGGRKHFVYSKVMAWVALDRAIAHHEKYDGDGDVKRWRKNREMLHRQICEKGFNKKLNSFTQSYGSKALDASCLVIAFTGFLPPHDSRIVGTIKAIQKSLMPHGLVQRYDPARAPDGLKGREGDFLVCSFWMVICLHLIDRRDEAVALFDRVAGLANDVGLISEEYDATNKRMLGNFPQALSHIGLVHAAFAISGQWKPRAPRAG